MRARIAERKPEILAYLREQEAYKGFRAPPIKRRGSTGPAPLSFAQERLWFLEQLEPGTAVYNICRASRLLGNLSCPALEASLNEIVSRHETLRTAFRLFDGHPVQVVRPPEGISIDFVDLRSVQESERIPNIQRQIEAEALRFFNLDSAVLLRCVLLRVGEQEHILVLTTHHSAADAWSMGTLTRELWKLYDAFSNGRPCPLEPLPVQYSDYAVWQREWLQGGVLASQLRYWKQCLKDLPVLIFPSDRGRKLRQSFCGARVAIVLPEDLTRSVNELSKNFAVTPFMTLLSAFQVLLYRYTGQEDVVVGSPIANRRRPELESLIGFFVNTLVLRGDLSGNPSFSEFLLRMKDTCLKADVNQDLPFEKLVQELQPERDQSRNPLFQVMFVLQNATRPFTGIPDLRIEPLEIANARSPFDLSLFLRERESKYIGYIEYSTDLFDPDRIERMAGHFQTLLEGIVSDPDQSIAILPILPEAERRQILVEWNDTAADYPKDKCIHRLFEEQVERTPEAIAVEFENQRITYRELNRRANRLAHYLISLGMGPEKLVGICLDRSIEMVVGLLGILKAGSAYVPLDPAYPEDRLQFMLEDSQCSVLLTQQDLLNDRRFSMPDCGHRSSSRDPQTKMVCLDSEWPTIAEQTEDNPKAGACAENLAYVIYTSGSTGQPKGVAIEHRNTGNLLCWASTIYDSRDLQGVLASTSICFDLSIFEIFLPLCCGGKVVLLENILSLREIPAGNQISLVNTVPSAMSGLLSVGPLPQSVRTVNLAGEPLRSELVKRIYDMGTVNKVYDLYGPSETTTYSTFTVRTRRGANTIGRPIANTQIYILDSHLQPVPVCVQGELYISGAGVARGYLNRPELTIETFIQNPFSHDHTSRLYRTGDSARYLPDGKIQFLGRTNDQVKIRGHRIELGEIEAVLNQHPAIKRSAIVTRELAPCAEVNLVAYVVPNQQHALSTNELLDHLTKKLPQFMMPSSFVILDALPLLSNGKVDRQKLVPADDGIEQRAGTFVAPRTELEELVAQVWKDVLKVENLGIHDNFFELGGHSLLAVQIIARLQDAFNREIPVRVLFDASTVAELALIMDNVIRNGSCPTLPPIVPVAGDQLLPLSLNQEHLWKFVKEVPGTHVFNMPYVYQFSGNLNVTALEHSLGEIIRCHASLRTVFADVNESSVRIIKDAANFQLTTEDLRSQVSYDVSQRAAVLLLEERQQPFALGTGPLFRAKLLRLTDKESLLLITMHHIISDDWSMQVFRQELAEHYKQFIQGQTWRSSERLVEFTDYASWEKRLLKDGLLTEQQSFWNSQLCEPLPLINFHKNRMQKKELSFRTARLPIEFDETSYTRIKALALRENCTRCMVLVAVLSTLLYIQTGQQDIRIGTLVANRCRRETQTLIGHLVNTIILRMLLYPTMTWKQLLMHVRQVTLAAYANQELPFEKLARELEREKKIKRESLFQVQLNYHVSDFQPVSLNGLTFAPLECPINVSDSEVTLTACDLILNIKETSTKLMGSIIYKTDSVDINVPASIAAGFAGVLRHMMLDGAQVVSEVALNRK